MPLRAFINLGRCNTKGIKYTALTTWRELRITDVLEEFRKDEKLSAKIIDRGFSWLDVGTFESMRDVIPT